LVAADRITQRSLVMSRFDQKVVLVTGAARGMGASHAQAFAAEGAKVILGDVLADEGKQTAQGLGDAARFVELDVTSEDSWSNAVDFAENEFGPINVLVNNAGIFYPTPIETTTADDFTKIIEINLIGTFLGMHSVVNSMRTAGGGAIVNISSTAGMMGYAGIGAYVASKWGVRGLTKTAAMELAPDGIRVVSVHPGPIHTPMTEDIPADTAASQPIPRFGEPEEVTTMVLFLASDDASYSTGTEFIVDGGALLGPMIDLEG